MQRDRVERVASSARTGVSEIVAATAIWRARRCSVAMSAWMRRVAAAQCRRAPSADQRGERVACSASMPALAHRDGRDHRHAELAFDSAAGIERQPVALGQVDHVERDHHRQAERDQLEREAQMVVEVGGVDHDDERVGQPLARLRAGDDVARHASSGLEGSRL